MKKTPVIETKVRKPYIPAPHPMQHRIDEFRKLPSLFTGGKTK